MGKIIDVLRSSKILLPIFVISLFLGLFLFFYIPQTMENGIIKNIVKHSKDSVVRLQLQREYYVSAVVGDVKKFAPKLSFDYAHEGVDAKLPFPTTTVHDLSNMYSQRSDVKFALYSNYPFLNRKSRVLTPFQKEAIREVQKAEDGLYYKKDVIDGKEVLRVAVADYMVLEGCVSCHNSHKLKDWDFEWKLGDKRGVLEVITPMDVALGDMKIARNKVVMAALSLMFLLVVYYSFILLRRESQLQHENEILNDDLKDVVSDFDKYVIASKTDLKGNITYASRKFCEISGYTKDELLGRSHNLIRHKDMPNEVFINMWKTIQADKIFIGEVKNLKKDGGYYWVNAIVSPIYDDKNVKIGYTAIRENITDKKQVVELNETLELRVEEEVTKNRDKDKQLLQQSRLAQMGEMISMIAHQWRQPLAAISSTSAAIELRAKLNKLNTQEVAELSANISRYSQHLSATINDFRDFFKSEKKIEFTSYCEIIDSVLNIVEASIENQNIKIIRDCNCGDKFKISKNGLKQVVLNIIKNAEDILLEKKIKEPYIKITTSVEDGNNILKISDNGGGVPEDIIDKIFDPYFSTKLEKNGTGLGLYMSKIIIQEHCNGKLSVCNKDDGAEFEIVLNA